MFIQDIYFAPFWVSVGCAWLLGHSTQPGGLCDKIMNNEVFIRITLMSFKCSEEAQTNFNESCLGRWESQQSSLIRFDSPPYPEIVGPNRRRQTHLCRRRPGSYHFRGRLLSCPLLHERHHRPVSERARCRPCSLIDPNQTFSVFAQALDEEARPRHGITIRDGPCLQGFTPLEDLRSWSHSKRSS